MDSKKPKINIGFRIGMLETLSASSERKNGYVIWNCKCECGNVILLDTRCLQRGTVRNCGCKTKIKPGQKDLTEQRFGKLTALEPAECRGKNNEILWRCRCDCGNEILAPVKQLISGYRKSCGCLGKPPLKDWIGMRFGNLEVIAYEGKKDGSHYWRCRCVCGEVAILRQSNLKSGHSTSCGCLKNSIKDHVHFVNGTCIEMIESCKIPKSNRSGIRGVYQHKKSGKWRAQITFQGKTYSLGAYTNIEEAARTRKKAEEQIFGGFLEWYYANLKNKGD